MPGRAGGVRLDGPHPLSASQPRRRGPDDVATGPPAVGADQSRVMIETLIPPAALVGEEPDALGDRHVGRVRLVLGVLDRHAGLGGAGVYLPGRSAGS